MSGKRRKYTPEFREQAARLVIETGRPVAHVGAEIGVGEQVLGRWVRLQREAAAAGDTGAVLDAGGDVDDRSTSVATHCGQRGMHHMNGRQDDLVDPLVDELDRDGVQQSRVIAGARRVHQHGDRSEHGATLLLGTHRVVRVGRVNPDETRVTERRSHVDLLAYRRAAFVIAPEQHHARTLLGELTWRLKPDTGRAAENRNAAVGDECGLHRGHGPSSRILGSEERWYPSKATWFLAVLRSHHPRGAFGGPPSMRMQEAVI